MLDKVVAVVVVVAVDRETIVSNGQDPSPAKITWEWSTGNHTLSAGRIRVGLQIKHQQHRQQHHQVQQVGGVHMIAPWMLDA
jgi:hypothetical protein